MESASQTDYYTIDDIYALPEGQRAELVDGEIYMMAPPATGHQRLVHFLDRVIGNYIDKKQGECEVFPAPFAVFLNADRDIYVEPDISVICDKNKIDDKGCHGAPDWIIEIVSPSSVNMDYMIKFYKYKTAGVREYWIIDQLKSRIFVYDFENNVMAEYSFNDKVKVHIYEDFEIDFSVLDIKA